MKLPPRKGAGGAENAPHRSSPSCRGSAPNIARPAAACSLCSAIPAREVNRVGRLCAGCATRTLDRILDLEGRILNAFPGSRP